MRVFKGGTNDPRNSRRKIMPESPARRPPDKATVAVVKGGPEFQAWFRRLQELTRLPAALLLDAALVEYARAKGFEEPPQR
jgi:hypothetical protein